MDLPENARGNYEVQKLEGKGKGLIAKKHFKKGDIIFSETPLVCCQFSWNAAYGYKACDYCLRPLETVEENARRLTGKQDIIIPYPHCCSTDKNKIVSCPDCDVEYCSEGCRLTALETYHKILCTKKIKEHPLCLLNETWKGLHYPPETCSIMLIARMIATVLQSPDRASTMNKFMEFCHRAVSEDSKLAHRLLGDQYSEQLDALRHQMMASVPTDGLESWFTKEGFQALFALVGTNGQGVGTSPISEWYNQCSEMLTLNDAERNELESFVDKLYEDLEIQSGEFLNNEGSALFELQSSCNHSCEPNAEPTFKKNCFILEMRAIGDISPGDEICISYLDECMLSRSRYSRQKYLSTNYLFVCKCGKCQMQAGDPNVTSEEESSEDDDMD